MPAITPLILSAPVSTLQIRFIKISHLLYAIQTQWANPPGSFTTLQVKLRALRSTLAALEQCLHTREGCLDKSVIPPGYLKGEIEAIDVWAVELKSGAGVFRDGVEGRGKKGDRSVVEGQVWTEEVVKELVKDARCYRNSVKIYINALESEDDAIMSLTMERLESTMSTLVSNSKRHQAFLDEKLPPRPTSPPPHTIEEERLRSEVSNRLYDRQLQFRFLLKVREEKEKLRVIREEMAKLEALKEKQSPKSLGSPSQSKLELAETLRVGGMENSKAEISMQKKVRRVLISAKFINSFRGSRSLSVLKEGPSEDVSTNTASQTINKPNINTQPMAKPSNSTASSPTAKPNTARPIARSVSVPDTSSTTAIETELPPLPELADTSAIKQAFELEDTSKPPKPLQVPLIPSSPTRSPKSSTPSPTSTTPPLNPPSSLSRTLSQAFPPKSSATAGTTRPILFYARASFPFTSTLPAELSFTRKDILAIHRVQPDGWWKASLVSPSSPSPAEHTKTGLVPFNYFERDIGVFGYEGGEGEGEEGECA